MVNSGSTFRRWLLRATAATLLVVAGWATRNTTLGTSVPLLYDFHSGAVCVAADGSLLVDGGMGQVFRIDPAGRVSLVLGNREFSFGGDGGPATKARISKISGMAVGLDGSLYVADLYNQRVRKVSKDGIVTTIAGSGPISYSGHPAACGGFSGDGCTATRARLNGPMDVALDAAGNLYIADAGNKRIRKVDRHGTISTVAGGGSKPPSEGMPAREALFNQIWNLAVMPDASLLFSPKDSYRVWRVDPQGILHVFAGTGLPGSSGDGGPALHAQINRTHVAAAGDGSVYLTLYDHDCVRRVDTRGIIITVAGSGKRGFFGDGGPATRSRLSGPGRVTADAHGNLYISDVWNYRIRKVDRTGIITTVVRGDRILNRPRSR